MKILMQLVFQLIVVKTQFSKQTFFSSAVRVNENQASVFDEDLTTCLKLEQQDDVLKINSTLDGDVTTMSERLMFNITLNQHVQCDTKQVQI